LNLSDKETIASCYHFVFSHNLNVTVLVSVSFVSFFILLNIYLTSSSTIKFSLSFFLSHYLFSGCFVISFVICAYFHFFFSFNLFEEKKTFSVISTICIHLQIHTYINILNETIDSIVCLLTMKSLRSPI